MSGLKRRPQQPQYYQQQYAPSDSSSYAQYPGVSQWQPQYQPQQQYYQPQQYPNQFGYNASSSSSPYLQPNPYQQNNAGYTHLAPEFGGSPQPRQPVQNFSFPASPNLESQVASLSLTAPLPTKPAPLRPPSTSQPPGEVRSDISLRYPTLPSIPPLPATPSTLSSEAESCISSLQTIISTYSQRDELLRLRTEAVGFQPRAAYLAWQELPHAPDSDATNPVLGVRLLQRLDKLQKENEELGRLLSAGASTGGRKDVEKLKGEVENCKRLIEVMDEALRGAEERAEAAERALEVACRSNSTSVVTDEERRKGSKAPPGKMRGGKGPTAQNSSGTPSSGGGKSGGQQRTKASDTNANTADPASSTSSLGGSIGGKNEARPKEAGTKGPANGKATRGDSSKTTGPPDSSSKDASKSGKGHQSSAPPKLR